MVAIANRFLVIESGRFEVHFRERARDTVATGYVHGYHFPTRDSAEEWAREHKLREYEIAEVVAVHEVA